MIDPNIKPTGCCDPFDPEPWDKKEILWDEKLFMKDHIKSVFHIPIDMNKVMTRDMEKIMKANAKGEQLMLSDEKSLWGSDIYIAVAKEVPDAQMTTLSGTFLTKVYEGPYKDIQKWTEDMKEYVKEKGKVIKKMYFCYTTCPNCAKAYGKNYVILFAQV
ncbi:MAG: hypothetical protein Q7S53_05555 [bacterium]|nr:hypothetical protein [bacterium]